MRLAVWLLVAANLLVAAWGAVEYFVGLPRTGSLTPEVAPERVKLLSTDETRERHERAKLIACIEWGSFTVSDADRAERYLETSGLSLKLGTRRVEGDGTWWVLIPSMPSRAAAEARLGQIKRSGVSDVSLVTDDPHYPNGISLGVYTTEPSAQRRRDELIALGIGDAIAALRASPGARIFLRLHEVPRSTVQQLAQARNGFAGAPVAECRTPESAKP